MVMKRCPGRHPIDSGSQIPLMERRHPKGIALVAVLWIVGLLALMAAGVGSSGRTSSHLAFNAVENAKARYLAEAGVNRALRHLLANDPGVSTYVDGSLNFSFRIQDDVVVVQIRDEDGKIDVNAASAELLAGLLAAVGLERGEAAPAMAARIVDFRDDDNDALPSGAEDPAYQAAGLAEGAADRPLRHLEELRSVLGMTDALFERLRPHVTVFTNADGLDPLRASRAALLALPGMTPDVVAMIEASTEGGGDLLSILPDELALSFEDYVLPSRELIFEIRALGRTSGGGLFLRESVVALDGDEGRLPFETYLWRRGTLSDDDPLLLMMKRLAQPS